MKNELPLTIETITPAIAEKYLKSMGNNRKRKDGLTVTYASSMDDGEWVLNGETIKFNAEGQLIDGQHRCEACILAGKPFKTYVARGIEDERAFATIDTGAVRTYGDVFSIAGIKNANNISAMAQRIYLYKRGMLTLTGVANTRSAQTKRLVKGTDFSDVVINNQLGKQELLEYAAPMMDGMVASLNKAANDKAGKLIPLSMAGALHFLFSEKSALEADHFIEAFGSGAGLAETDPVHALRNKLIAHMGGHARLELNVKMAYCIIAWNKRRAGDKLKVFKLPEDAKFPKIT